MGKVLMLAGNIELNLGKKNSESKSSDNTYDNSTIVNELAKKKDRPNSRRLPQFLP